MTPFVDGRCKTPIEEIQAAVDGAISTEQTVKLRQCLNHIDELEVMADITFTRSLCILMDALMASLQEILKLNEEQLAAFTADFISRLPQYLQNALDSRAARA